MSTTTYDFHYPGLAECCVKTLKSSDPQVTDKGAVVCARCNTRLQYNLATGWRNAAPATTQERGCVECGRPIPITDATFTCAHCKEWELKAERPATTQEQQHTATPWYVASTGNHQGLILEEETGRNIAVTCDKADAPIIVKCVNSHERLVAALTNMLKCADVGDLDSLANASDDARAALAEVQDE